MSNKSRDTIQILFLIVLGLLVFSFSFRNGFVLDDRAQIVINPLIHDLSNIPHLFTQGSFFTGGAGKVVGGYYRPMMSVIFALIFSLTGNQPAWFHIFQVGLHIVNAGLVFWLFRRYFTNYIALFLATLFLVHPINVETVVFISNLQDILFVFFGLLLLHTVIAILATKSSGFKVRLELLLLSLLSLLSKESGIVMIVVTWWYVYLYGRRRLGWFTKPMVLAIGVYLVLRDVAVGLFNKTIPGIPISEASLFVRIVTIPKMVTHYLNLFLYPAKLQIFSLWVVRQLTFKDFWLPLTGLIGVGIGLSVFYRLVRNRADQKAFRLFLVWLVCGLFVYSQLIPLDATVADRWFYSAQIGLLGILGLMVTLVTKRLKFSATFGWMMSIAIVGLLSYRSIVRITDWKDEMTLVSHDLQLDPNNYLLEHALAYDLIQTGQYDEAIIHAKHVTELAPQLGHSWNTLGYAYEMEGDTTLRQRAYEAYQRSLYLQGHYLTYANLAHMLIEDGHYLEAIQLLQQGTSRYPENPQLWYFLMVANRDAGNALAAQEAADKLQEIQTGQIEVEYLGGLE